LIENSIRWLGRDFSTPGAKFVCRCFRPVAAHLAGATDKLAFADAQLLISAQTTSRSANALYGAAALDLSRRGVVHLMGGMGGIAQELVRAVRLNGGKVHYRQEAVQVIRKQGRPQSVKTRSGESFPADLVIFNLPGQLKHLSRKPGTGWGAFVVYIGVDRLSSLAGSILHHQIVLRQPLAEGNSVFCSISPEWDKERAPEACRAVTLSTHTSLEPWWQLLHEDREAYEGRKAAYTQRLISAADAILPGFRSSVRLALPGTPVTFQRYTRRARGWVGGFPQSNLFDALGPRLAPGLWMVGDSIFPGQSVPAVALGGLRVASEVMAGQTLRKPGTYPRIAAKKGSLIKTGGFQ
jgi:phytoene dehydrogenase-like protein